MSKKISCTIVPVDAGGPYETKPSLIINGRKVNIEYGKPLTLDESVVEAAEATDRFIVKRHNADSSPAEDSGDGDGAAAQPGGLDAGGADTEQDVEVLGSVVGEHEQAGDVEQVGTVVGETGEPEAEGAEQVGSVIGETAFDAAAVLEGPLKDVEPRIAKLETLEQVEAVRKAAGPKARKGTLAALKAREADLKGGN